MKKQANVSAREILAGLSKLRTHQPERATHDSCDTYSNTYGLVRSSWVVAGSSKAGTKEASTCLV